MLTVLGILVFAIIFAIVLLQIFALARAKQMTGKSVSPDILKRLRLSNHSPALLYFTSPTCSMCRIQEQEMAQWKPSGARFVKVNIAEHLDVARYFNIMGTPSFVLLGEDGNVKQVLIGRQSVSKLDNLLGKARA
ncbi:MAG: thioredoxin [Calditrichaeota bacterium]|nr:MAG: thioredoxin [Calditrichota bacterium]